MRLRDFSAVPATSRVVVVTNEDYRFIIADQLQSIGITSSWIVLEPVGRNTAPALTLAALLLTESDDDPIMLVMAADHVIANIPAFHAAVAEAATQAEAGRIVTFGIVPDRPETGYGYIRVGGPMEGASTARAMVGFVEKPDAIKAKQYLASGEYLWNSGMFMVRRSIWLSAIERHRPKIAAACTAAIDEMRTDGSFRWVGKETFAACPSDSIDYAVIEELGPSSSIQAVVVPLDAGWSDIGAWDALWTVSSKDDLGNVTRGNVILEDTRNTLVHAETRLVTVLGGEDLVIVDTADALLVARKDRTCDLKRIVARVHDENEELTVHHRRVHRPWGAFDSIHSGKRFQVKHIQVSPGASLSLQLHKHRAEHWVVVRGVAEVTCGDRVFRLHEDESTYVPVGTAHRLTNPGIEPLEIIEVQSGDYLGEDDIVRLEDRYGRIESSSAG